jgi:imidazoleglycerol phosphate synthase cyclase subunit
MHKRIIARLDVKGDNVIKGIQMEGLRVMGSIEDLARRYYSSGVSEILILDAVASLYGRQAIVRAIRSATADVFVPVTVGGGIRSLVDATELFEAGADRVALNSAAMMNPGLFSEIANVYGSQAVVASIEAKRVGRSTWNCFTETGRQDSGIDVNTWISRLDAAAVGELLVTSVDFDGTKKGPDLELLDAIAGETSLPIVYSGGIRSVEESLAVLKRDEITGVAFGSALHYQLLEAKEIQDGNVNSGFSLPEVLP